jgi:site-specific DNA recombinase
MTVKLRCAIYTRKSSEEGLDQHFNSLHAQREACEAYVLSQAGEGWTAIKTAYDDGGYSGGSMERPGLERLMADIQSGLVDVVVVYKVDRLTRSLADFAKIVEVFDARGVSFVSVTQAFNTTSSMGRLTLNVLLSFAQFEREVTGERIRDKIAASKAKGLRMGGRPPIGYDIEEGRLVVNEVEAPKVVDAFERYLTLGSIHALLRDGVAGKVWVNRRGESVGGGCLTRGALHYFLTNPAYRGITRHKDKLYGGTHPGIVSAELWDKVQAKLQAANASQPKTQLRTERATLQGLVFDDQGHPMQPVHTKRGVARYRYYVSRASLTRVGRPGSLHRISAGMLEQFLTNRLAPTLTTSWEAEAEPIKRVSRAVTKVVLSDSRIIVHADRDAIVPDRAAAFDLEDLNNGQVSLRVTFHMRRRQGALILEPGGSVAVSSVAKLDRALVRGLVLARRWMAELEGGQVASISALASRENLCGHYTARLLPLAYLAPDLTEQILAGRQPKAISLSALTAKALPSDWAAQRAFFQRIGAPQIACLAT